MAIANGDGEYASLDMEIRLVFRSLLSSILNRLEDANFDTEKRDYNIDSYRLGASFFKVFVPEVKP